MLATAACMDSKSTNGYLCSFTRTAITYSLMHMSNCHKTILPLPSMLHLVGSKGIAKLWRVYTPPMLAHAA